jgi:anti-sigma B factor antagonist
VNVEIWEEGEIVVATLSGEINGNAAPLLEERLLPLADGRAWVLLDMSGVTFISSVGLRVLLYLYREITACEGCIALVGLPEDIRDTMTVTGFLDFFDTFATVEEGLAVFSQRQPLA